MPTIVVQITIGDYAKWRAASKGNSDIANGIGVADL
jgi:hypothetical protein